MARNDGTPGAAELTTGLLIGGKKFASGALPNTIPMVNDAFLPVAVDPQLLKQYGQRAIQIKVKSTVVLTYKGGGAGTATLAAQTFYETLWVDRNGTVGELATADITAAIEYRIVMRNLPENEAV